MFWHYSVPKLLVHKRCSLCWLLLFNIDAFLQEQQKIKNSDSEDIFIYLTVWSSPFPSKNIKICFKNQLVQSMSTWIWCLSCHQTKQNLLCFACHQTKQIWCLSCHQTKKSFCRGESRFHWLVIETWPDLTNATWCGPSLVPDMSHSVIELYFVPWPDRPKLD